MRTCPACNLAQEHPHPYCKKCGAALEPAATAASPPASTARVCPGCGLEQSHSHPFCKRCGAALSGAAASGPLPPSRCALCGAPKETDWLVCEHCGAGAARPAPASRWHLWAGLGLFTAIWVAALIAWWCFSFRVTLGPLAAGSALEIDGKAIATFPHGAAEYSALLSRGQHSLAVSAPGHRATDFAFRIGWSGLRRRFVLWQVPEIACVMVANPPYPTVTIGASWPDHPTPNEYCAPVGTQAVAEWRTDPTLPPVRQAFQYANDGDVVAMPSVMPVASASATSEQPAPNQPIAQQGVGELVQSCRTLFGRRDYKAALATCNQALSLDPRNQDALRLQAQIRQTMQILGIQQ